METNQEEMDIRSLVSPPVKRDADNSGDLDQIAPGARIDFVFQPAASPDIVAHGTPVKPKFVDCDTCLRSVSEHLAMTLSCFHVHCYQCIATNAKACLNAMPFNPAKCCHVIPTRTIKMSGGLAEDEINAYDSKMEELTNPNVKLYCSSCGSHVVVEDGGRKRTGECGQCSARTCKSCHLKSHWGPCSKSKLDEIRQSDQQIYKLAKSNGWKSCPNCRNVIQKRGGCNNVT